MNGADPGQRATDVRLAELLAALSLAVDLGLGQPMDHVLRQTLIAMRLGESFGLSQDDRAALYYVALLAWVGCGSDSHELATWFGDDLTWRAASYEIDPASEGSLAFMRGRAEAVYPPLASAGTGDPTKLRGSTFEHCVITKSFAERIGLGPDVADPLIQLFERWDGRGRPNRISGEAISLHARIVGFADVIVPAHRAGGVEAAVTVARSRSGSQFDPAVVERFCSEVKSIVSGLDEATTWDTVLGAEPGLQVMLTEQGLDAALEAIADFSDLKSPFTVGHARGVARLAEEAARALGLPQDEITLVRHAALVQDVGRMGISNSILDRPSALPPAQIERVRLHAYYVERMFLHPSRLRQIGALAAQHHERLDGSGYPRGLSGTLLSRPARILGAADVYHALTESRPHRPALAREDAAAELRSEVKQGRFDGEAVNVVLTAAGHRVRRRRQWPAGLSPREVEVLRLIARGLSTREVAAELGVAEKTVGSHIEHVYAKIGSSTRAEASLFAMQHGLL